MIVVEEKEIRNNLNARSSDLLKRVLLYKTKIIKMDYSFIEKTFS